MSEKTQAIFLYWFASQQQTSTSRRPKFDFFIQNLVLSLLNLVFSSKSDRKWPKNGKNWNSPENHLYVAFGA